MPTLISQREIKIEFTDLDKMVPKPNLSAKPRSSGVHLSGVIKHVLTAGGLLTPDELGDEMPIRMCVGMAWEAWVVQLWPELVWQPGECRRDGIVGSPDGVTPGPYSIKVENGEYPVGSVLEEVKATWMSRRERTETKGVVPPERDITKMKRWMWQLAGYLYMLGLTEARMHVLWINGDYRSNGPQYFTYQIQFTQLELERFWKNIVIPNIRGAVPETH